MAIYRFENPYDPNRTLQALASGASAISSMENAKANKGRLMREAGFMNELRNMYDQEDPYGVGEPGLLSRIGSTISGWFQDEPKTIQNLEAQKAMLDPNNATDIAEGRLAGEKLFNNLLAKEQWEKQGDPTAMARAQQANAALDKQYEIDRGTAEINQAKADSGDTDYWTKRGQENFARAQKELALENQIRQEKGLPPAEVDGQPTAEFSGRGTDKDWTGPLFKPEGKTLTSQSRSLYQQYKDKQKKLNPDDAMGRYQLAVEAYQLQTDMEAGSGTQAKTAHKYLKDIDMLKGKIGGRRGPDGPGGKKEYWYNERSGQVSMNPPWITNAEGVKVVQPGWMPMTKVNPESSFGNRAKYGKDEELSVEESQRRIQREQGLTDTEMNQRVELARQQAELLSNPYALRMFKKREPQTAQNDIPKKKRPF